jgi:hypothetical protein
MSSGLPLVPSPVNLAVVLTVVNPLSADGAHTVPFHFNTCPFVAPFCAIVGFGYVPVKSPPADVDVVISLLGSVSPVFVIVVPVILIPVPAVYVVLSSF